MRFDLVGVSSQPTAPRFWRSCSLLRAPMRTEDTVGLRSVDDGVEVVVGHGRAGP